MCEHGAEFCLLFAARRRLSAEAVRSTVLVRYRRRQPLRRAPSRSYQKSLQAASLFSACLFVHILPWYLYICSYTIERPVYVLAPRRATVYLREPLRTPHSPSDLELYVILAPVESHEHFTSSDILPLSTPQVSDPPVLGPSNRLLPPPLAGASICAERGFNNKRLDSACL